jgi:hypothetical protein
MCWRGESSAAHRNSVIPIASMEFVSRSARTRCSPGSYQMIFGEQLGFLANVNRSSPPLEKRDL